MESTECGAAALAMVLAYFGKFVSLEQLRVACGVTRDGSKASNMVKAARQLGLLARGFRKEPADLRSMPLPMIIFWNFNHFVVLDGFGRNKVFVNDPGLGRRVVDDTEFDQAFTGIALTFEPGPDFMPDGRAPSLIGALRRRLHDSRPAIGYLVLVGLALVMPGLLIPAFTSIFIDRILVDGMYSWTVPLIGGMLFTVFLLVALTWLQRHYLLKLEVRIALSTSATFFWHVLRLPLNFYTQRSAGDIGARVNINDRVAATLSEDLVSAVLGALTSLFFAAVMLSYDVTMGSIVIGIVALNGMLLYRLARLRKEQNQKLSIDRGKVMGAAMGGLMMIESLKASGAESDFFNRWAGYQTRLMNSVQVTSRTSITLDVVPKFLTAANSTLMLGIGGMRVMDGAMTIGTLVAFQALVASFVGPCNALVALGSKVQGLHGDMDRLDDVMDYPCQEPVILDREEAPPQSAKLNGGLELRNISFGYSPLEVPLFENFNLEIKPGARIALVGASGCGKSTIAKLVVGLYIPWDGDILFDGKPRSAWPRHQMLNSLAAVDQDIALFSGTVRDNLTMWDDSVDLSVVVAAAKDACVHDIISSRPGGYDGKVDEGGSNFSGGQRQRLEIARALTANPRLLVLDEASSALDPLTEKIIEGNLRRRGCSCLVVAHRLSSVRDCDEIIVLERGKVVERGTHEALLALDGHYTRLIANE